MTDQVCSILSHIPNDRRTPLELLTSGASWMYSKKESEAMKVEGSGELDLKRSTMPHPQEPTRLGSCYANHEDVSEFNSIFLAKP